MTDEAAWRSEKGEQSAWGNAFLGVDKKTQVADAEETHYEPASSVLQDTERDYYTEQFLQFAGISGLGGGWEVEWSVSFWGGTEEPD